MNIPSDLISAYGPIMPFHGHYHETVLQTVTPAIQPIAAAGSDVANLASSTDNAAKNFFIRLLDQPFFDLVGALVPIVMALVTFVDLTQDFVSFIKAACHGLGRDAWEYIQKVVVDVLRICASLLSPVKFLLLIFNRMIPLLLIIAEPLATSLFLVCAIWRLITEVVGYKHTTAAMTFIDQVMNDDKFSTAEKTTHVLNYFKEIKENREEANRLKISETEESSREATAKFLEEQAIRELKELFGENTYEWIILGIDSLNGIEEQPEKLLKAENCVREIQELLIHKRKTHCIAVAMAACTIAASVFALVSLAGGPLVGGLILTMYAFTAIASSLAIFNGVQFFFCNRIFKNHLKEEEKLEQRVAKHFDDKAISGVLPSRPSKSFIFRKIEDLMEEVHLNYFEQDSAEEKRHKIENLLISSHLLKEHQKRVVEELKARMAFDFQNMNMDQSHARALLEDYFGQDLSGFPHTPKDISKRFKKEASVDTARITFALRNEWMKTYEEEDSNSTDGDISVPLYFFV